MSSIHYKLADILQTARIAGLVWNRIAPDNLKVRLRQPAKELIAELSQKLHQADKKYRIIFRVIAGFALAVYSINMSILISGILVKIFTAIKGIKNERLARLGDCLMSAYRSMPVGFAPVIGTLFEEASVFVATKLGFYKEFLAVLAINNAALVRKFLNDLEAFFNEYLERLGPQPKDLFEDYQASLQKIMADLKTFLGGKMPALYQVEEQTVRSILLAITPRTNRQQAKKVIRQYIWVQTALGGLLKTLPSIISVILHKLGFEKVSILARIIASIVLTIGVYSHCLKKI